LQQALAVVDELFTRVSEDELLNEPGMQPLRKDLLEKYPTAGLAVIDFDLPDWNSLTPGSGRLERFITPRAIGGDED
jgi:phosphohistidine phosphatase